MDIMTLISNTLALLNFTINLREIIDIMLASLKEHYGKLFEKTEDAAETPVQE